MMEDSSSQARLWAAGLLAFRQKPEGGSDYFHTVLLIHAPDREHAAQHALADLHRRCPDEQGWQFHQASVTSMGEAPSGVVDAGSIFVQVWNAVVRAQPGPNDDDLAAVDELTAAMWADRLCERATGAVRALHADGELSYRDGLIEVAAMAIRAVQAFDRGASLT